MSELMEASWTPHETALVLMVSQSSRALGFFFLFSFFFRPEMNELLCSQTDAIVVCVFCIWNFYLELPFHFLRSENAWNYTYTHTPTPISKLPLSRCEANTSSYGLKRTNIKTVNNTSLIIQLWRKYRSLGFKR